MVGGAITGICFFMPWLKISCMGTPQTLTGPDLAKISALFWVILGAATITIGAIHMYRQQGRLSKAAPVIQISSVAGMLTLAYEYFRYQGGVNTGFGRVTLQEMGFSIEFGAIGATIGLLIAAAGTRSMYDEDTTEDAAELICYSCGKTHERATAPHRCSRCGARLAGAPAALARPSGAVTTTAPRTSEPSPLPLAADGVEFGDTDSREHSVTTAMPEAVADPGLTKVETTSVPARRQRLILMGAAAAAATVVLTAVLADRHARQEMEKRPASVEAPRGGITEGSQPTINVTPDAGAQQLGEHPTPLTVSDAQSLIRSYYRATMSGYEMTSILHTEIRDSGPIRKEAHLLYRYRGISGGEDRRHFDLQWMNGEWTVVRNYGPLSATFRKPVTQVSTTNTQEQEPSKVKVEVANPGTDWTFQQIKVPATSAEVTKSWPLAYNVLYKLEVSGTYDAWGRTPHSVDAVACFADPMCTDSRRAKLADGFKVNGQGLIELSGGAVQYNAEHEYSITQWGNGQPLEFYIQDARASSRDNAGALTVRLTRQP